MIELMIIFIAMVLPLSWALSHAESPQLRRIHIENFRYGKAPSIIHCNRGDTLVITMSSRDTGHSIYMQEFDIDAKVNPGNGKILQFKISDPTAPPTISDSFIIVADHPGFFGQFVSKTSFRCHVWCGPMHAFEHGVLILHPNFLLNAGIGALLALFLIGILRKFRTRHMPLSPDELEQYDSGVDLFQKFPGLKRLLQKRWFQPLMMSIGAVVLYLIVMISIFGTQMSGRNLGVLVIWIVWMFFVVTVFTPLGGRSWCTICPIPMAGEFLQRRSVTRVRSGSTGRYKNKLFGLMRSWPKSLDNGWLRLLFFLLLGTFSTTLVVKPEMTGYAILFLVILSMILSMIFEHRSFCRYLCPINTFIAIHATSGKLALRKTDATVCEECRANYCEKGSKGGYPCPYGLNVADINDNFDCGMCTECMKSCLYDNVTLRWRKFGSEISTHTLSRAITAIAMFVLGTAYTITYLGPWAKIRDYVNIIDKGNWDLFAIYGIILWLFALVLFPLALLLVNYISKKVTGIQESPKALLIASSGSIIPLSLSVWTAFIVPMLFVNITFIQQALSDPLGWGWNLFGQAGSPWVQLVPRLIPWLQVIFILMGFAYSFRNAWRIWLKLTLNRARALKGLIPLVSFYFLLSFIFIWYYAN